MSYEAKFLNDEEFDALPYPETDVSLGIADPETRMAYVRRSGVPVVDAFRLAHELEHLDEDGQGIYSDHFKHGVYYKQDSWIAPVLSSVLNLAGKAYPGAQIDSQFGGYLSSPSVLKPQPAQGEQTGRPGQQPASVIQSTPGFGAGAGGPGSMGLGPDVMKNIREKLSGTQAGRNTVMDLYGAPNPERGFGMNQGETF